MKHLGHAKAYLESEREIPPQAEHSEESIQQESAFREAQHRCVFCGSTAHIGIDDENITFCTRCLRVLQAKKEAIARFLSA